LEKMGVESRRLKLQADAAKCQYTLMALAGAAQGPPPRQSEFAKQKLHLQLGVPLGVPRR
jgi:hypothetical protein